MGRKFMHLSKRKLSLGALVLGGAVATTVALASSHSVTLTDVPTANAKSPGYAPASKLSPELQQEVWAQGSTKLENPTAAVSYYGYENDVLGPDGEPQMVTTTTPATEAQKTEPDKNTYLVFGKGLPGADKNYDYGTHFLFQGHELGSPGYITRINLDADAAHRVTLLATKDENGQNLPDFDGSTWDPWAKKLLFTTENGSIPGVYEADLSVPANVQDLGGSLGKGGYEGIQNDSAGNVWIVEDQSGDAKGNTKAKRPNSFVYRFVPTQANDLTSGKLQALQVLRNGTPVTFDSQAALMSSDQVALHTYGNVFPTRWITIHDTSVDGTAPFDANALAKAKEATPFKRPENGQFRPGSHFRQFYFDETGDTNADSPENDCCGGWTAIQKLTQTSPSADTGKLTLFYKGDEGHAGFDNAAFLTKDLVTFVEDAGDTLHTQREALDSGYVFDARLDYSDPVNQPVRWLAEGRDPSATIDSANGGFGKNEGDNEITGMHVSDGNPTTNGILGAQIPHPWEPDGHWRVFYTQQHGDNPTYEVIRAGR
jgi:hypothetical protein